MFRTSSDVIMSVFCATSSQGPGGKAFFGRQSCSCTIKLTLTWPQLVFFVVLNLQRFNNIPVGATCPFSPIIPCFGFGVLFLFVLSCPWSSWSTTPLRRCSMLFLWGRANGAAKGSCGETVVQKGVFGESVSSLLP